MADDPRTFDDLMARMGVKKLAKDAKVAKPSAKVAKKKVVAKKPEAPTPSELDLVRSALTEADKTIASLRAELADAERPIEGNAPSLPSLLEARGVRGADEARYLLDALASARLTDLVLPELLVRRPERLARFLGDRVQLTCAREGCPTLPGSAILTVPAARCDACGGGDIERARRRFHDACLVNGMLLVGLIGGTVRDQRLFDALAAHHRISLKHFASAADARAAGAQLVIGWNAPLDDGPNAVQSAAKSVVALLDEVAGSLLS